MNNRLRAVVAGHRATVLLVALLAFFLLSGQSSSCRFPIIQSAEFCCDCVSLISCPPGVAVGGHDSPGLQINFEANSGQADPRYPFVARGSAGLALFFAPGGEVSFTLGSGVIKAGLAGAAANLRAEPEAESALPGRINYFIGNDPSKWVRDVPTFAKLRYRSVYPGIDLVYYGASGLLEHDFVVAPGADPRLIRLRFDGATAIDVNQDGEAVLRAGTQSMVWKKPQLYQSVAGLRRRVEGRYRIESHGELGFEVGVYDPNRPLIIDPVVIYSTYLGRGGNETASRLAVDNNGNIYFTGVTVDNNYPVTPGSAALTPSLGRGNIVVTKMNAEATELVYSAIIGGSAADLGLGIALDAQGAAYIAGSTASDDFPTTAGVVQRSYGRPPAGEFGNTPALGDCFITRLNSAGNAISFSTYLGGSVLDGCSSIALDGSGNILVTGGTNSANFPTTEGSFQRSFRGGRGASPALKSADAFVAKLNNSATQIVYATFLGGNGEEAGTAIASDAEGNAYVTGATNSTFGFPLSAGAPQTRYVGAAGNAFVDLGDAFLIKLDPTGSSLVYGTLLGGAKDDIAFGIAVDEKGAAYIAGSTLSSDFPTTAIARQSSYRGQSGTANWFAGDAFAAKLNPAGTAWEYTTYLGGTADDRGAAIAVAAGGAAWVLGHTRSNDYWITEDATQRRWAGERTTEFYATGDVFLSRLAPDGGSLQFSTYLGGQGNDWALGLAADARGNVYVAGGTSSPDFPTTAGVYQRTFGTAQALFLPLGDVFLAKFGDAPQSGPNVTIAAVANSASYDGSAISPGEIIVVTGTAIGPSALVSAAPSGGLFPTTLAEARILIGGKASPIIYASGGQTAAIVPWDVLGPNAEVVAEYQGVRSRAFLLPVASAAPGLYSANASGRGPAAALNQDLSLNSASRPADPGSVVVLYGTGEGRTLPASVDGRITGVENLPRPEQPVNVTIGGQRADVVYAGAAPGLVSGVLQLNVRVPAAIAAGNQPVVVRIGDRASQAGLTISVR